MDLGYLTGFWGLTQPLKDYFTPFWDKFDFPVLNHQFHVDLEDSTRSYLGDGLPSLMSCQVPQQWPSARGGSSQPLEVFGNV